MSIIFFKLSKVSNTYDIDFKLISKHSGHSYYLPIYMLKNPNILKFNHLVYLSKSSLSIFGIVSLRILKFMFIKSRIAFEQTHDPSYYYCYTNFYANSLAFLRFLSLK